MTAYAAAVQFAADALLKLFIAGRLTEAPSAGKATASEPSRNTGAPIKRRFDEPMISVSRLVWRGQPRRS
jgi:hypothetical protein